MGPFYPVMGPFYPVMGPFYPRASRSGGSGVVCAGSDDKCDRQDNERKDEQNPQSMSYMASRGK